MQWRGNSSHLFMTVSSNWKSCHTFQTLFQLKPSKFINEAKQKKIPKKQKLMQQFLKCPLSNFCIRSLFAYHVQHALTMCFLSAHHVFIVHNLPLLTTWLIFSSPSWSLFEQVSFDGHSWVISGPIINKLA